MDLAQTLIKLAQDPSPAGRQALVSATADQFLDTGRAATPAEQKLFSDILVKLYGFARQEIRQRLSAALAMADWAPPELVRELALDAIDIARPVISFCPVVTDEILIEVIHNRDFDHRLCIAERPCIGEGVSRKLISTNNDRIVAKLARNVTARIHIDDFKKAIEVLAQHQDDVDALVVRHDLPPSLVATAYALAGAQTKLAISMKLPAKLDQRLTRLTEFIASDSADGRTTGLLSETLNQALRSTIQGANMMPTPGVLLAALMRGERNAFFAGLGAMLNLPSAGIASKMLSCDIETLALVARAADFDASVVRTIFETLKPDEGAWNTGDDRQVALVWMRFSTSAAKLHFSSSLKN